MRDVFNDPQVRAIGMPIRLAHPEMGEVYLSGSGVSLVDSPVSYRTAPPLLGEHTDAILAELEYDEDARRRLRQEKVI